MKFLLTLLFVAAVLPSVHAKEAESSEKTPPQESPALPAAADPRPDRAPSLTPETIRPAPKPTLPFAAKNSATFRPPVTAAELDMRIRYRQARNIAEADPRVRAAWDESRTAQTDYAKRKALKLYYDSLLARVLAIDSGVAPLVEQRRRIERAVLEQLRIAPTGSLE